MRGTTGSPQRRRRELARKHRERFVPLGSGFFLDQETGHVIVL